MAGRLLFSYFLLAVSVFAADSSCRYEFVVPNSPESPCKAAPAEVQQLKTDLFSFRQQHLTELTSIQQELLKLHNRDADLYQLTAGLKGMCTNTKESQDGRSIEDSYLSDLQRFLNSSSDTESAGTTPIQSLVAIIFNKMQNSEIQQSKLNALMGKQIAILEGKADEFESRLRKIQTILTNRNQNWPYVIGKISQIEQELQQCKSKDVEIDLKVQYGSKRIDELENIIRKLQTRSKRSVVGVLSESNNSRGDVDFAGARVDQIENEVSGLHEQLKNLSHQLSTFQANYSRSEVASQASSLSFLVDEISKLKNQMKLVVSQINDLTSQLVTLEKEEKNSEQEINAIQLSLSPLKTSLASDPKSLASLSSTLRSVNAKLAKAFLEIDGSRDDITKLKSSTEILAKSLNDVVKKLFDEHKSVAAMKQDFLLQTGKIKKIIDDSNLASSKRKTIEKHVQQAGSQFSVVFKGLQKFGITSKNLEKDMTKVTKLLFSGQPDAITQLHQLIRDLRAKIFSGVRAVMGKVDSLRNQVETLEKKNVG